MRWPFKFSPFWSPFFRVFGYSRRDSHVELADGRLSIRFGTAKETMPLGDVSGVSPYHWPFTYGPGDGVAYVSSTAGVVRIDLSTPHALNVWGPFKRSKARCVVASVEEADGLIEAVREAIAPA